jgi:hypothetical protein
MNAPKPFTKLLASAIVLACALLPGCAGYRLGSMLPPDIKLVHVPTFINKTSEPQLEIATTRFALQEFQKDGSLKLSSAEEADAILEVKLTDYKLAPLQYDSNRPTAALEYRITLYASIVLTRKRDGKVIAENPRCFGEGAFPVVGDLSSSKLTGLPIAAKDLAHDIVQKVTEVW